MCAGLITSLVPTQFTPTTTQLATLHNRILKIPTFTVAQAIAVDMGCWSGWIAPMSQAEKHCHGFERVPGNGHPYPLSASFIAGRLAFNDPLKRLHVDRSGIRRKSAEDSNPIVFI